MVYTGPQTGLVELARKQLGGSNDAKNETTLSSYIRELEKHVEQCPNDTNFSIKLEPRTGFGVVTCLESGCRKERIRLAKRLNVRDGGKSEGLGSLSNYRVHIQGSAMHVESRNARLAMQGFNAASRNTTPVASEKQVKSERPSLSMSPEKRQRITKTLATSPYKVKMEPSPPTTPIRAVPARGPRPPTSAPGPSRVLPSPNAFAGPSRPPGSRGRQSLPAMPFKILRTPSPVITKRKSSTSLSDAKSEEDRDAELVELALLPSKRAKVEDVPISFPEPARSTDGPPHLFPSDLGPRNIVDAEEIRDSLNEVERGLREVEQSINRAEDKATKTKADVTRMTRLALTRRDLQAQKAQLTETLENTATRTRIAMSVARSSTIPGPNSRYQPYPRPEASGSNVKLEAQGRVLARAIDGDAYHVGERRVVDNASAIPDRVMHSAQAEPEDDGDVWGDEIPAALRNDLHMPFGTGANQYDVNQFVIAAGNAEVFDQNSSVNDALRSLGLQNIYDPLPGMKVALMAHQAIGVAWLAGKENEPGRRGGILADEMGLGKTVQMLALMAKNRPPEQCAEKTTLIVAHVALLDQWHSEIMNKTDMGLRVLIFHGDNRPKKLEVLQRYDVIITTYHTLMYDWELYDTLSRKKKSYRRRSEDPFIVNDEDGQERRARPRNKQSPHLLHKIKERMQTDSVIRFRVILDEAHYIRNPESIASQAVAALTARYRWCLTGTPIINVLADAFPYFRFLKIRPWNDWQDFRTKLLGRNNNGLPVGSMRRLQGIFSLTLLRRKKDSTLNGEPLIVLPLKTVILVKLDFSQEERDLYDMVEGQSQMIFNRYRQAGTVLKNYFHVLALLLRLRQICSHATLITQDGVAYIRPGDQAEDSDRNAQLIKAERIAGTDFVELMKTRYLTAARERIKAQQKPADESQFDDNEDVLCAICLDTFDDPVVTTCGHVYCRRCIVEVIATSQPTEENKEQRPKCPECRGSISETRLFSRAIFEPTAVELRGQNSQLFDVAAWISRYDHPTRKGRRSSRRRSARTQSDDESDETEDEEMDDEMRDFIVDDDESEAEEGQQRRANRRSSAKSKGKRAVRRIVVDSEDEYDGDVIHGAKPHFDTEEFTPEQLAVIPSKFLPSTKMKYMMDTLCKLAEEHPDEKVLVISQWTQCLDLVSHYLAENKILHVKYQGDMSKRKRTQAVEAFMRKDRATVMLMSLKCGGVGLNLTRANHVINLDLAWSPATELQAFDRVHRLGQTRPVHVPRLVINRTIEDRILELQQRKQALADGSLGENGQLNFRSLTVEDWASLFNLNMDGSVIRDAE